MSPAHPAQPGGTGRPKDGCRGPGPSLVPGGPDGPPGVQEVS